MRQFLAGFFVPLSCLYIVATHLNIWRWIRRRLLFYHRFFWPMPLQTVFLMLTQLFAVFPHCVVSFWAWQHTQKWILLWPASFSLPPSFSLLKIWALRFPSWEQRDWIDFPLWFYLDRAGGHISWILCTFWRLLFLHPSFCQHDPIYIVVNRIKNVNFQKKVSRSQPASEGWGS